MYILGIETSCDETAAAVVKVTRGRFSIVSSVVLSQIDIHRRYGGVVPEVAARNHSVNIIPVIDQALADAGKTVRDIDRIAVTYGPGLITSLAVGVQTAKTLAFVNQKPLFPVDHMRAHIYANWVNATIAFPALCLVVSGGHTELVQIKDKDTFKKVGQTLDDAAGEAFDKTAKLLGLPYPGGPQISILASKGSDRYAFPRPMIGSGDFNFSFSGLKTAVLYQRKKIKRLTPAITADLCRSFEQAVVDTLTAKTFAAAEKFRVKTVMLAGGVAANQRLRQTIADRAAEQGYHFSMPALSLCTDNAAMIAVAGFFAKERPVVSVVPEPNLTL